MPSVPHIRVYDYMYMSYKHIICGVFCVFCFPNQLLIAKQKPRFDYIKPRLK